MIRITVCDDKQEAVDDIVILCNHFIQERGLEAEVIGVTSPLKVIETEPDAVILDIEMPELSGIQLKEQLELMPDSPYIIFATNYEENMADAFGERVIGFLKKPVEYERLAGRLSTIVTKLTYFTLITFDDGKIINSNDVVSIKVSRGYSQVNLADGSAIENIRKSLVEWERELRNYSFMQIDKSHLVNCRHIKDFRNGTVYFADGSCLKVSVRRKVYCWERYLAYVKMVAKYA
ncbi:MAG: LytTR family DNA-binding domain-containing protein [Muribaculaceae bacterium]